MPGVIPTSQLEALPKTYVLDLEIQACPYIYVGV